MLRPTQVFLAILIGVSCSFICDVTHASDTGASDSGASDKRADETYGPDFRQTPRKEIVVREKLGNFALVYLTQWAAYAATQTNTIRKDGSWSNWIHNPFSPHFDKDSFDFNLIKHTFTGHYYYLYYRTCGYSEKDAFLWSALSSAAFEFTIETITERPSFQDVYQTPVYGTLLGMGVERVSDYLISREARGWHYLGYLLNPLALLPFSAFEFHAKPVVLKDAWGFNLSMDF